MSLELLYGVILVLIGIIIGGTGGQALLHKALKVPEIDSGGSSAVLAAAAAATAAAAAANLLSDRVKTFEYQLSINTQGLSALKESVDLLSGACPERHKAIEQRLESFERELRR